MPGRAMPLQQDLLPRSGVAVERYSVRCEGQGRSARQAWATAACWSAGVSYELRRGRRWVSLVLTLAVDRRSWRFALVITRLGLRVRANLMWLILWLTCRRWPQPERRKPLR